MIANKMCRKCGKWFPDTGWNRCPDPECAGTKERDAMEFFHVFVKCDGIGNNPSHTYPVVVDLGRIFLIGSIVASPAHVPQDRLASVIENCWSKRFVSEVIIRRAPN